MSEMFSNSLFLMLRYVSCRHSEQNYDFAGQISIFLFLCGGKKNPHTTFWTVAQS